MVAAWTRRITVLCVLFLACACQMRSDTIVGSAGSATAVPLSGRVTFAGSTTVQPLAAEIGKAFNARYPDVVLEIAAGGSGVGIQAIRDGAVDIGMSSRALKPDEREGMQVHQIAVDVIAVVVNDANPVENLTAEQLRDIYLGSITNWASVEGPDAAIVVAIRETTSGTRKAFDELVLGDQEPGAPNLEPLMTAGDVAAFVIANPHAVGYIGFGNFEEGLKPIAIDGTPPTEANALSGAYPLTRPLLLLTGPLSQPLASEFINFALSDEGQGIVTSSGWLPAK